MPNLLTVNDGTLGGKVIGIPDQRDIRLGKDWALLCGPTCVQRSSNVDMCSVPKALRRWVARTDVVGRQV
jgi:hypothetical protein